MEVSKFHEVLREKGYKFSYIDGVTIINHGGNINLNSLTEMSENVYFNNIGYILLNSLAEMSENVHFNNVGFVWLGSLTSLPENIVFNNGGYIDLGSLTTLPDNIEFSNVGAVFLNLLHNKQIKYKNKEFTYKCVDSIPMLIDKSYKIGDITVSSGYVFEGGDLDKLEAIYLVEKDEFSAHGKTAKSAIEDLNFKILSENLDVSEVVNEIKTTNKITKTQYRLLTGACDVGVELFKKENNITTDEIDLSKAIELTKGQYGHDRLVELVG